MSDRLTEELRALVRPIGRMQLLMWSAIFFPPIMYGVILLVMKTQGIRVGVQLPPVVFYLLGAAAGLSVVVGIAVHVFSSSERFVAACVKSVPGDQELARDPQTRRVSQERLVLIGRLSLQEKGLLNYARKSLTVFLLSIATVHTCAVAGLLLAVLAGRPLVYLPFAVLTVVATLFMRPRVLPRIEEYLSLQPQTPATCPARRPAR